MSDIEFQQTGMATLAIVADDERSAMVEEWYKRYPIELDYSSQTLTKGSGVDVADIVTLLSRTTQVDTGIIFTLDGASTLVQNALLLSLEKTSPGWQILIVARSTAGILPTILSRVTVEYIRQASTSEAVIIPGLNELLGEETALLSDYLQLVSPADAGWAQEMLHAGARPAWVAACVWRNND